MEGESIKVCQSCGMPITKAQDFGTNSNRSKNEDYCKFCFTNGKFADEGISMEEKIEKNIEIAKNMGMSEKKTKELANKVIPKLKRWEK